MAAAGAAGGTELSDAGAWTTGEPLVHDLKTTTVRAMYNHNDTRGVWFYMFAGASGTVYSWLLPGQDDEVIAYHSSGAVSGTAGGAYCNPRDWWCNDLTLGAGVNEGGWPKWTNHTVLFRDDGENYTHYLNDNWGGITAVMRRSMHENALPSAARELAGGATRFSCRSRRAAHLRRRRARRAFPARVMRLPLMTTTGMRGAAPPAPALAAWPPASSGSAATTQPATATAPKMSSMCFIAFIA